MTVEATAVAPKNNNEVAVKQPTHSERFTAAIEREFSTNAGELNLTPFQKKLCQNYFIKIDTKLKELEIKRLKTAENYRDPLAFSWENINLAKLAIDVIAFSGVGLDPAQPNHIYPIPYKNTGLGKYDITFIPGYRGTEIKARKYGLDIPDDVIVELVHKNDKFKQFKKDMNNKIEHYTFEIVDDFNRGEVVGGFYYHKFFDKPEKNRIKTFSKEDIEKRKPDYASPEFWGGEKDEWKNNQKTGQKIKVEGWYEEMCYKTIYRAAYSSITIDSEKIDNNYMEVIKRENDRIPEKIAMEIKENANRTELSMEDDFTAATVITADQQETGQPAQNNQPETTIPEVKKENKAGF